VREEACLAPPDACERLGAGRFGFDRDMGATKAMAAASEPGCAPGASADAVQLTALALTEVKLRFYEPLRRFKVWREVRALLPVLGTALQKPALSTACCALSIMHAVSLAKHCMKRPPESCPRAGMCGRLRAGRAERPRDVLEVPGDAQGAAGAHACGGALPRHARRLPAASAGPAHRCAYPPALSRITRSGH
jgi:hypothetical protein